MCNLNTASDDWWAMAIILESQFGETPRETIILALTGWVGARVVICRNGNVEIIVRSQFCDKPTNLCSDRQETGHNDRWTSSGITFPLQNCHYMLHHHIAFDSDTSEIKTIIFLSTR